MWTILYIVLFHYDKVPTDHQLWLQVGFILLFGATLIRQGFKVYKEKENKTNNKNT